MGRRKITASTIALFVCFALATNLQLSAQTPETQTTLIPMDLQDVVGVEPIEVGATTVTLLRTDIRAETRTKTVPVTRMRQETRTARRVNEQTGQTEEREYTVEIPYTESVTMTKQVFVPVGIQKREVPIKTLTGWDINGKKLGHDELIKRLSSQGSAILFQQPWEEGTKFDKIQTAVIRKDILILYAPQSVVAPKVETRSEVSANPPVVVIEEENDK